jgi:hypothetical protein
MCNRRKVITTPKKIFRPKKTRDWQKTRTKNWRERYYALGLTYKKVNGFWGWAPRKGPRHGPARLHLSNPSEIEKIRKKIQQAKKKKSGGR